jgi:hypothetical protein
LQTKVLFNVSQPPARTVGRRGSDSVRSCALVRARQRALRVFGNRMSLADPRFSLACTPSAVTCTPPSHSLSISRSLDLYRLCPLSPTPLSSLSLHSPSSLSLSLSAYLSLYADMRICLFGRPALEAYNAAIARMTGFTAESPVTGPLVQRAMLARRALPTNRLAQWQ